MRRITVRELLLSGVALAAAGVSPNLFWIAQGGVAKLSTLAVWVLIPSALTLLAVLGLAAALRERRLVNRMIAGGLAGGLATIGLEIVRSTGFHLGQMPGSMPQLAGVLLLDRFMLGPSVWSNIAGWTYHYWNGISFGVIFAVVFGRKPLWVALGYGVFLAIGFLVSPAVTALGVGFMGTNLPGMPVTVLLAHLVYAALLGLLTRRWVREPEWILGRVPLGSDAAAQGGGMTPQIELIYFDGCPHAEAARSSLRRALQDVGLPATWTEWERGSAEAPDYVAGYGSPTVLVDGRDVGGDAGGTAGAACRADGAPSPDVIATALRRSTLRRTS